MQWNNSFEEDPPPLVAEPSVISFSVGHQMMEVAYSKELITLWDLREDAYYGSCGKKLVADEN